MIRFLILLLPIFVSIFWLIALYSNKKNHNASSQFFGVFMLFAVVCFVGQFLFFAPLPNLFPYYEPIMALFGSLVFPIYYIYFRLLTVDEKFTFKKHSKYLILPFIIASIYIIGIFLAPFDEYKIWLYNDSAFPNSKTIVFLSFMRKAVRLTFAILLVATFILNFNLLKKYAHKAEMYYSDVQDGKYNNAKKLNYFLIIISISSLVAMILGRKLLLPKDAMITIIWLIFAFSMYGIGYMGFTQKPVNPTFDPVNNTTENIFSDNEPDFSQQHQQLLQKLMDEFDKEKIYLNTNLNINDLVRKIGSNRSYVSAIINQNFNLNFCSFVNTYRLKELERLYTSNPTFSNSILAEQSGFGSYNSMKRTIESQMGMSVKDWKINVLQKTA